MSRIGKDTSFDERCLEKLVRLEDIKNQRDEQRISARTESVFAISAVLVGLRHESTRMAEGRKEGGFVETDGGSPLLTGKELQRKV